VAKKGSAQAKLPIGNLRDTESLYHYLLRYLQYLAERHYSPRTIESREVYLRYFVEWCDERGLGRPQDITKPMIERYQRYLFVYRKKDGEPLTARSQNVRVIPIRSWFKWLSRQNYLLYNPAADIELPRMEQRLPRHILSIKEVETVLSQPDTSTSTGLRDRAMLEVLYSTGMRRMELINLKLFDIDMERGTVMVRQGKGRKDRMIPMGARAIEWVEKYQDDVRPGLASGADEGVLFLTHLGQAFTPNRLTQLVREYVDAAKLNKRGSCHLFRHTMATLMLENGADIRFIQAMLGHVELNTTQIYTQVSIRQLKAIHTATHPAKTAVTRAARQAQEPLQSALNEAMDTQTLLAALEVELEAELKTELRAEGEQENDADGDDE
jgi:integrase/recombinase XerD